MKQVKSINIWVIMMVMVMMMSQKRNNKNIFERERTSNSEDHGSIINRESKKEIKKLSKQKYTTLCHYF